MRNDCISVQRHSESHLRTRRRLRREISQLVTPSERLQLDM